MTLDTAALRAQWEAIREQQGPAAFAMIAHVGDGIALLDALEEERERVRTLAEVLETREIQVKRLQMAVQFDLNSLPTMREETRAAGLVAVAEQIERNRVGLERIMASVDALEAALATAGEEGATP